MKMRTLLVEKGLLPVMGSFKNLLPIIYKAAVFTVQCNKLVR